MVENCTMAIGLNRIGQIALTVRDVDSAEAFYQTTLRLRKLYRFGDLTFFDCAGVRLLLEKAHDPANASHSSPIYFSCNRGKSVGASDDQAYRMCCLM